MSRAETPRESGAEAARIRRLLDRLLAEEPVAFEPGGLPPGVPDRPAVYVIRTPDGRVAHVGRSVRLRRRLSQHFFRRGNSSFAVNYLIPNDRALSEGFTLQFLAIDEARERALVEALGVGTLCPLNLGTQ